jgi:hypothetical protein
MSGEGAIFLSLDNNNPQQTYENETDIHDSGVPERSGGADGT